MVRFKHHQKNYEFLKSFDMNQILTKRNGDISFVAEGLLEQFQMNVCLRVGLIMVKNIFLVVLRYSVK